jgi:LAS superfamily LD-carboxypeptidase LdcB
MQRAAHHAGVYLALTSGFRTTVEQQYLYGCYRSGN